MAEPIMGMDPNPPAFPSPPGWGTPPREGMSLRDWFAGMAMQGLIAGVKEPNFGVIANWAYTMADVLLKRRQQ